MTVGWGVIGCSDIVRRRAAAAILAQPDSRIAAFFSHSQDLASEHAEKYGGHAYSTLNDLLADDGVQIAYVASPAQRHVSETIAAAEAGKHVLVEKPMALTGAECDAMIAAAQSNGVKLSVAYYARWLPKVRYTKQLLEEGVLGAVVRAHVAQLEDFNPAADNPKIWRVQGRAGGGSLADVGSHRLDLLYYLLGRPVEVWGACDNTTRPDWGSPDTETIFVRFACGTHLSLACSWNIPHGRPAWELYGSQASIMNDPWSAEPLQVLGCDDVGPFEDPLPENAHFGVVNDLARAVVENRPPEFDAEEAACTTRVIEAAAESSRTGQRVLL